jgi:hypothetical protein
VVDSLALRHLIRVDPTPHHFGGADLVLPVSVLEKLTMVKITLEEVECAMEQGAGICTQCGSEQLCVEPDAENYECEQCGEFAVCGAEEILFLMGEDLIDE